MKVLRLWHAAVVPEYRKKIRAIAALPDIRLTLVSPLRWREGGRIVFFRVDPSEDSGFQSVTGRVAHENNIRRYYFLTGLFSAMRRVRPDIIDCEEEPFSAVVRQVLIYRKILGLTCPVIFHSAHVVEKPLGRKFNRYERLAFRDCAAALVRCPEAEIRLRTRGFQGPVIRTANGIDTSRFRPDLRLSMRSAFGWEGRKVVGYIGKLTEAKGLWTLVRAFETLDRNTVLLLVGGGPLQAQIRSFFMEKGWSGRLRLTGAVEHGETVRYYNTMDALVLPSETQIGWRESFGRVLIEAMACGIPVIGSDSGAIPGTIGDAGVVFPQKDPGALALAVQSVLGNSALRSSLAENGLRRAVLFSWEAIAETHRHAYAVALDSPESRPSGSRPS